MVMVENQANGLHGDSDYGIAPWIMASLTPQQRAYNRCIITEHVEKMFWTIKAMFTYPCEYHTTANRGNSSSYFIFF